MSQAAGVVPLSSGIQSGPVDLSKPISVSNLEGKTVVITGGASGIGAALATHFAQNSANVIIGDVSEAQGTALVAQLRLASKNANHHFIKLDVTNWNSQLDFFKSAKSLSPHQGIDCVIANAGINDPAESEAFEVNVPKFSAIEGPPPPPPRLKTLRVDLDGVLYTAHLALSYLAENPGSEKCSLKTGAASRDRHLLLVSSIAGVTAVPGSSIYGAAKHGVVGLFRSLRLSAPLLHGVRVNLICPQYVETAILGVRGTSGLLGVPKTRIEDVVEGVTRLVADQAVIGRALVIGTRVSEEQVKEVGLADSVPNRHKEGAIWEIYGHDFEQTDLLMRRVVGLLNLVGAAQGWANFINDLFALLLGVVKGLFRT